MKRDALGNHFPDPGGDTLGKTFFLIRTVIFFHLPCFSSSESSSEYFFLTELDSFLKMA